MKNFMKTENLMRAVTINRESSLPRLIYRFISDSFNQEDLWVIVTNVQTHHVALIYIVTSEFPRVLVTPLCMVNFVNPAPRTCIRAFACHNGHAHLIRMSAHNKIHIQYSSLCE